MPLLSWGCLLYCQDIKDEWLLMLIYFETVYSWTDKTYFDLFNGLFSLRVIKDYSNLLFNL